MLRPLRNLHFEVRKVLCLPRNLHFEFHYVLRLQRKLHFKVRKVLRLPRNLQTSHMSPVTTSERLEDHHHVQSHLPRNLHVEVEPLRSLAPVTKSRLWTRFHLRLPRKVTTMSENAQRERSHDKRLWFHACVVYSCLTYDLVWLKENRCYLCGRSRLIACIHRLSAVSPKGYVLRVVANLLHHGWCARPVG